MASHPFSSCTLGSPCFAGVVDAAFTSDLAEALVGPVTVRDFAAHPTLRTGAFAEHGTAVACALAGTRWPRGAVPGATLLCAMTGAMDGDAIAAALCWLAEARVDVVVLPFGAEESDSAVETALAALLASPSPPLVFAALGNTHPAAGLFPARSPGVCAVAAVDAAGRLLDDAARSPAPHTTARAERVIVRVGASRVAEMRGSSIACALAAGAALCRLAGDRPRAHFTKGH
ncbi:MAG: S8 family serine peptidase [Polyangiaceae bacterium]|nr:S8 family serine peptidase [Polyangiaceae bacterium]